MSVRDRTSGHVSLPAGLERAFPAATGHLVVLLHGLFETERCWEGTEEEPGLAEALEDNPMLTPVAIRYNSGLRVSDNGARLAGLLDQIHAAWPVPVESVSLVGHSMGGLVIRSACGIAEAADQRWIDDVDDVVTLGTPHRGSPLEKAANVAAWALAAVPDTRPLADFLNTRSAGIKDLRFGAVADDDWRRTEPDLLLRDTVGDHPLPSGIRHHFIAGVATADPTRPLGRAIGDFVVRPSSATGGRDLEPTSLEGFATSIFRTTPLSQNV
jgi:pimeloyl-ACP methyl ester carboxylesterase